MRRFSKVLFVLAVVGALGFGVARLTRTEVRGPSVSQVSPNGGSVPPEPAAEAAIEAQPARVSPGQPWTTFAPSPALRARVASVRANTHEMTFARLNPAALSGKTSPLMRPGSGELSFVLPEGATVVGRVERTTMQGPDSFVSEGTIPTVPGARWLLASVRGRISASIDGLPGGEVKLRTIETAEGPVAQLYRVDPKMAGDCIAIPAPGRPPVGAAVQAAIDVTDVASAVSGSGQASVDLLVVYSSAARAALGGEANVEAEALLAVGQVNADFANSGLSARIRLAGTLEVSYPGDELTTAISGYNATALENITGVTDGIMDEVHAARDAAGADLVTLVLQRPSSSSAGIAYILERVGHYSEVFFGFSVVNLDAFSDATTLTHELGHNFGCAHDRENAGALPARGYHGAFPGAYGTRRTVTDTQNQQWQIRSLMAYAPGTRVRYFSGPEVRVSSFRSGNQTIALAAEVPLGVAVADDPDNAADNVAVIERTAFQVAGYRLSPERSFDGRLVNVSTRAYVGTGYQALVGGFVVAGDQPKQVLVRAPGPTLGLPPYNLTGVLADPVLRLVKINAGEVAANDDWELPVANGAAAAVAGQAVGAFAFGNGQKDAALVAQLEPGFYSAEVSGAGGSEGTALVEVYDATPSDSGAARLLNLSTRAYASTVHPIVAGFVVRPDSVGNKPKTMFVRVRGPSLAHYGLPADEVMPDPMIEIYDDQARLVYQNDDWDAPTAILDQFIPDLQRGVVDQVSEEAVFAAAAAVGPTDMLPVEPGAVIELPVGLYTMFVRPFTSERDPVGEPGVAIVEVFELSQ